MILSDTAILAAIDRKEIVIDPFDPANLGGNSYDVHLSPHLLVYQLGSTGLEGVIDAARETPTTELVIPPVGLVLWPRQLYLASTVEYTETHRHVPYIDGRSSVGRLGMSIHATAGRGDVGFRGHWTLEVTVVHPVRVYAGLRIGQLTYHAVEGEVVNSYATKASSTYGRAPRSPKPVPSRLWRSFRKE
jgi:dCTP deaminase